MLVSLSQQAAELLVTLAEVRLTRCEGLVALTQLLVQLSTTHTGQKVWKNRGRGGEDPLGQDKLEMGCQMEI